MYGKDPDGNSKPILVNRDGQIATGLAKAAIEGRLFHVNTATTVECSTTLHTTFTGLAVGNPANSGKYMIFHEFGAATKDAIGTMGILALALTTVSGLAQQLTAQPSMKGSGAVSVSYCDEAATIVAPVVCKTLGTYATGASGTEMLVNGVWDLKGSIVLAPGQALVTDMTLAPGNSMSFHFQWEEVDI